MNETIIVEIATGVLTLLLTIIGYLLSSKDSSQEKKLLDLDCKIEEIEKILTELRVEIARSK